MQEFVAAVRSATKTIYYSTFLCNATHQLPGHEECVTVQALFTDAVARNVEVFILYNPETHYGNLAPEKFIAQFPEGVRVRAVYGSGTLNPVSRLVSGNQRYSNHHQKYLCVDGTRMLVTGCDIDPDRAGWLQKNRNGYYWHELLVSVPCSPEMYTYVQRNFESICEPPPPLTCGKTEHDLMVCMIKNAKHFVHMEAQICVSTESTQNRILTALADRLAQSYKNQAADRFFCFFLTNLRQVDESKVIDWMMRQDVYWSRRHLRSACQLRGVPWSFVIDRVLMGTLQAKDGIHVKVHSNMVIADGRTLLRTSSNLSDRSMSSLPCDTELGIVVRGPVVAQFQRQLFERYLGTNSHSPWAFFKAVREQTHDTCLVSCVALSESDNEKTVIPDTIVNSVMAAAHTPKLYGGREKITWKVVEVDRPGANKANKRWTSQSVMLLVGFIGVIVATSVVVIRFRSKPVLLDTTVSSSLTPTEADCAGVILPTT